MIVIPTLDSGVCFNVIKNVQLRGNFSSLQAATEMFKFATTPKFYLYKWEGWSGWVEAPASERSLGWVCQWGPNPLLNWRRVGERQKSQWGESCCHRQGRLGPRNGAGLLTVCTLVCSDDPRRSPTKEHGTALRSPRRKSNTSIVLREKAYVVQALCFGGWQSSG